ncbi:MAG: hypothetical protein PUJ82_07410 [Spirochaetales bacterium]|mgnify:FL=1|nr:hypothetical protein [Spirochaetales bacterium]MDY5915468.1 hypothetical protein [Treponema sp.]
MNNIDWKAFETNMSLMLINMKLESLPTDLEKLVDKSYELADNAEKDLKKESEKTFADIEKMPEVIEETSDGEPFCEKNWIESQAEDYFCEQNGIIELYNKSINLMLINFFVETFEGLKKNVGDKLKKEKMETTTLDRLVYAPADDDMLKVRLINNCIKHNDSKVSDDLSRKFPGEYTKNDEIDINPELVYELLEITVNAIRKFNKLFNQYYHD